ncbi:hypothetical protein N9R66_01280 [bacterium]|nr:hypothetical protein [bacterium]
MALSLAACGGSSTTTTTATDTTTTDSTAVTTTTPVVVAKEMTLTLNEDSGSAFTGTSSADTFNAKVAQTNAGTSDYTLQTFDVLDGGAGSDTLNVTLDAETVTPVLTSIETLNVKATGSATLALGSSSGVTNINNADSSGNLTASGVASVVELDISGIAGATTTTLTYAATVLSGTADAQTLSLGANTSMGDITIDTSTAGHGLETLNLAVNGKSTGTAIVSDAATVNITGSGDLKLTSTYATATAIDASAATGKMELTSGVAKVAITTGSAADKITLTHTAAANEFSVSTGAGDDSIILSNIVDASELTDSKVTIDGGAGVDTVTMLETAVRSLGGTTAAQYALEGIANIEKIAISNDTTTNAISMTRFGVDHLILKTGIEEDTTITMPSGSTLELDDMSTANTKTATMTISQLGAGQTETFSIDLGDTHTANLNADYGVIVVANTETINIVSGSGAAHLVGTGDNEVDLTIDHATTVNVSGTVDLDIDGAALDQVIATFNAADLSGDLAVTFAGGVAVTFTGGSGADTITGSSNADVISTGAGKDVIVGGAGADNITTGAGADKVTIAAQTAGGIDVITDFNADEDTLAFKGGAAFNNITTTDLSASATLQAAAGAAVAAVKVLSGTTANWDGAGDTAVFSYGGKTYATVNAAADANYTTGDALVDITGFTGTLSAADFVA